MGASQREFFDGLAARWDSLERADIRQRLDRVVREAGLSPGMRVLDVGTGTGVLLPSLLDALRDTGAVCAIDISPGMLDVARAKGFPASVSLELGDVLEHQAPAGGYDRVMCNAVLPHFSDKAQALSHIHSLLRPGGRVVISHPTGRAAVNQVHAGAGPTVAHDRVPVASEMRALLEGAGFDAVTVTDEPEFYLAQGRRP